MQRSGKNKKSNAKMPRGQSGGSVKKNGHLYLIVVCQMQDDENKGDLEMVNMGKTISAWKRFKNEDDSPADMIKVIGSNFSTVSGQLKLHPYKGVIICGHCIYYPLDREVDGPPLSHDDRHVGDCKVADLVGLVAVIAMAKVSDITFVSCEIAMTEDFYRGDQEAGSRDTLTTTKDTLTFEKAKSICKKISENDDNVSTFEMVCANFFLMALGDEQLRSILDNQNICISGLIGVGFIVSSIECFHTFDQINLNETRNKRKSDQKIVTEYCLHKKFPDIQCFDLFPPLADKLGAHSLVFELQPDWDFSSPWVDAGRAWCDLALKYGFSNTHQSLIEALVVNLWRRKKYPTTILVQKYVTKLITAGLQQNTQAADVAKEVFYKITGGKND